MPKLIIALLLFLSISHAFGQAQTTDFYKAIQTGSISIESLRGNGSSTGMAVEGNIRNRTQRLLRISTTLLEPLYLANRGLGQNMVAFNVFEEDGSYYSDGQTSFIEVRPNDSLAIKLLAYCADYEKENPTAYDQFVVSQTPANIRNATTKILAHKRRNPNDDSIEAYQVALWLAQGVPPDQIRETFEFTSTDEFKARRILQD